MVREYEDMPSDNLLLVFDPAAAAGDAFEAAVSLAATVCWEWCRRKGDRLIAAVAGDREVFDGVGSPSHGRRVLERLALVQPSAKAALPELSAFADVAAAAVIVSVGPGVLAGPLARMLRRPVAVLDAGDLAGLDFYQPPGVVA
jgi:hypothetical protein